MAYSEIWCGFENYLLSALIAQEVEWPPEENLRCPLSAGSNPINAIYFFFSLIFLYVSFNHLDNSFNIYTK